MGIRLLSLVALLPLLVLQACASTPFGQQLSDSFDPQDAPSRSAPASPVPSSEVPGSDVPRSDVPGTVPPGADGQLKTEDGVVASTSSETDEASPETEDQSSQAAAQEVGEASTAPDRTRPYRIILRLSAADPAAPAEGVTDALRRAGIGFEVETIEKVPSSELNRSSTPEPKPAS